ncbi:MAG: transporter substrate-binding domain-containing protein, partial [Pseudomonadales bacterium]|nr:transporter substrate-binding domain-containing protein [Pseudomonadales bacterium]
DLQSEIRPRLLELGDTIIQAIRAAGDLDDSMMLRRDFVRAVKAPGLSDETRMALYDALIQVEFFPSRLDQILAVGEIRIGTTGDYAPFSFRRDESFTGIDIDLARDLANSLDVEAVFVPTSWPTLMQDLAGDRFDIGMSGISRSLERQRVAYFSMPYHIGGKTPIARCDDKDALDSLEEIDRPGVRVIVNPGGTNERFVRERLGQASVRVFDDNRSIFDEIIAGHADVMITDAIEVRLKSAMHPELCATLPGETFTYQQKGYLLPRDDVWKEYVNTWLSQRIADGTVEAIFNRHLQ